MTTSIKRIAFIAVMFASVAALAACQPKTPDNQPPAPPSGLIG
jgi:hypothetical protein